ncbi:hypothetical protein AGLY_006003 [Aphis glycines]|uniref:Uncharacterized protein n=1 Tax=Aphis glycines TaxID=307491 RepID=A0A6G0TSG9_APHGL|nr:hypothetical protein AGLY_006003 [Aphis glycines]
MNRFCCSVTDIQTCHIKSQGIVYANVYFYYYLVKVYNTENTILFITKNIQVLYSNEKEVSQCVLFCRTPSINGSSFSDKSAIACQLIKKVEINFDFDYLLIITIDYKYYSITHTRFSISHGLVIAAKSHTVINMALNSSLSSSLVQSYIPVRTSSRNFPLEVEYSCASGEETLKVCLTLFERNCLFRDGPNRDKDKR